MIGDFNVDLQKIDRDNHVRKYANHLLGSDCKCGIDVPTRTTITTNSLLDHIYTKEMRSDKLKFDVMKCEFSYHDLTFALIKSKTAEQKQKNDAYVIRDTKQFQHERFLENMNKLINTINFNAQEKSKDEKFADFLKSFIRIVNSPAPLRHATRKEKRLKAKPWLTNELLKSIRTKNKMFKQVCKKRDCGDDRSSEKTVRYKKYRNLLNRAIPKAKPLLH